MSTPPYLHPKNSGARRQPRLLHPGLKINSERLSGSQSVVHFVVEVATGKEMICKIIKNADLKSFTNELKALQAINDCGLWEHGFPRILSTMQDEEQFEILIEAQGKNLRQVLDELKQENYTKSTIMKIGIQALDLLELLTQAVVVVVRLMITQAITPTLKAKPKKRTNHRRKPSPPKLRRLSFLTRKRNNASKSA